MAISPRHFSIAYFDEKYPKALLTYVFIFCIYLTIGWLAPSGYFQDVKRVCALVFVVVGSLLLLYDLLGRRSLFKIPFKMGMLLFLAAIALSSVVNISYGWADNFKCFVWTCIQIGLMVPLASICSKDDLMRMFRRLFIVMFAIWTVGSIVSIMEWAVQIGYAFVDGEGVLQRQGFIDGRLFGIFIDPNYAACFALGLIVAALCLMKMSSFGTKATVAIWAGIAINWVYFILAESRTSHVALVVVLFLFFVAVVKHAKSVGRDEGKRAYYSYAKLLSAVILSFALVLPLASAYATWVSESDHFGFKETTERWGESVPGREDISIENVSNNRFDIWRDYLYVAQDDFLIGKSPRNDDEIILERYPNLYISTRNVDTIYLCHNGYLDVFVATGFLGFVGLAFTAIGLLVTGFRYLARRKTVDPALLCATAVFSIICVKAMTHTVPFFVYSIESNLFWIILGYLLCRFGVRSGQA